MHNTIDDVIKTCEENYKLLVTEENRNKYLEFLKRQLNAHKEYDLNFKVSEKGRNQPIYFELMKDTLLIFSCLIRQRKVKVSEFSSEETLLDNDEKLHLLRVTGASQYLWVDRNLYNIYGRREYGNKKHGLMRYTDLIDEIGKDEGVVSILGRKLSYKADIATRIRKPR